MPSLLDDLDRLAHRGAHADPARVVAAAIDAAAGRADRARYAAAVSTPARGSTDIDATDHRRQVPDRQVVPLTPTPRRRPIVWGAAAAALVGVAVAAVAFGSGASPRRPATTAAPASEPVPVATAAPLSAADQALQAMYLTLLDIGTRDEVVLAYSSNKPQSEIAACMAAAGFEYTPEEDPVAAVDGDSLYALSPADFATEFGFGIVRNRAVADDPGATANENRRFSMQPDELARWDAAERQCRTSPDRAASSNALQVALPVIRTQILGDPAMVAALDTWRTCVTNAGYSFESPLAMRQSFYDRMNGGAPRAALRDEEIATATATLGCNEAYDAQYRSSAIAHFADFQEVYDTSLRLGLAPEAQG